MIPATTPTLTADSPSIMRIELLRQAMLELKQTTSSLESKQTRSRQTISALNSKQTITIPGAYPGHERRLG
jgi:hypothetical protein